MDGGSRHKLRIGTSGSECPDWTMSPNVAVVLLLCCCQECCTTQLPRAREVRRYTVTKRRSNAERRRAGKRRLMINQRSQYH